MNNPYKSNGGAIHSGATLVESKVFADLMLGANKLSAITNLIIANLRQLTFSVNLNCRELAILANMVSAHSYKL